jgi:hypothetical protein
MLACKLNIHGHGFGRVVLILKRNGAVGMANRLRHSCHGKAETAETTE